MDRPEKGLDFVLDALQQLQLKEQFVLGLNLISRAIFDPVKLIMLRIKNDYM